MDVVDKQKRSEMMSGIRSKNTRPEMIVRKFLHANGFRFRLHNRALPGSPDIVLSKYKTVVFVHGCFWHRHSGCKYSTIPSTNVERWQHKFQENIQRDLRNVGALQELGWKVIVVWECDLRGRQKDRLEHVILEIAAASTRI